MNKVERLLARLGLDKLGLMREAQPQPQPQPCSHIAARLAEVEAERIAAQVAMIEAICERDKKFETARRHTREFLEAERAVYRLIESGGQDAAIRAFAAAVARHHMMGDWMGDMKVQ